MSVIFEYYKKHPLRTILLAGLFFRLLAVIFSQGYGMFDDHFLIIESSQSWVDGRDYNNWLPWNQSIPQPVGFSLFYPGLHYLLFLFLKVVGITDAATKMYIVRFIHAIFSMLVIYFGFRISYRMSGSVKTASNAAWVIALLWGMPFLSVRNLVEMVCIPFLMLGIWYILLADDHKKKMLMFLIAGIWMGIAFSIRFQTMIFIGGTGLVLLVRKQWKETFVFGAGFIAAISIFQGLVDYVIWGYPFAEFIEYVKYNITARYDYVIGPWYNFIVFLMLVIFPPAGFLIFFGFLRSWKKYFLIFLPVLIFIAFHSYFPNKQERFILPVLPFYMMLGFMGWNDFYENSRLRKKAHGLITGLFVFFWIINLFIMSIASVTYSKKAIIESMRYVARFPQATHILMEDTNKDEGPMMPQFYLNRWIQISDIAAKVPADSFISKYDSTYKQPNPKFFSYHLYKHRYSVKPYFILFVSDKNLEKRVENIRKIYPRMKFEAEIKPSFVDHLMFVINPTNRNETIYIYRSNG
jgi:4-amino-4-deoxy-L-arabinose transferase-like glycosyltransferase